MGLRPRRRPGSSLLVHACPHLLVATVLLFSQTRVIAFPNILSQVSEFIQRYRPSSLTGCDNDVMGVRLLLFVSPHSPESRGPPWSSPRVKLTIGDIGLPDTDGLAEFMLGCEGYDPQTLLKARPELSERLKNCLHDGVTLTAATDLESGNLVGMYACTDINHLDLPSPPELFPRIRMAASPVSVPRVLLSDLKISPAWRRRGVATQLLQHLEEDMSSQGGLISLFVAHNNLPAKRLYAKMAYVKSDMGLPKSLLDLANVTPYEALSLHYLIKYVKRRPNAAVAGQGAFKTRWFVGGGSSS